MVEAQRPRGVPAAPIQRLRGTRDILPEDQPAWRYAVERIHAASARFGYRQLTPPMFEDAALFLRGVGEGTELRDEQMYRFRDPGGEDLILRAEGTAPFVRAYLEHGMHVLPQPVKLYGVVDIFRFERPQAGRFRQHVQWNVEAIGQADAAVDAEVISLAWSLLLGAGLGGLSLQLSSIGDAVCRPGYVEELVGYYRRHEVEICPDCQRRLRVNPPRVLDCKDERCQPVKAGAPRSFDHLCPACQAHFDDLRGYLEGMAIAFELNHLLVRGLDYYTRTVFEIWAQGIGAQNAVGGGGRYDGLAEQLGGRPTPGVGFGLGLDRLAILLDEQGVEVPPLPGPQVYVAYQGRRAKQQAVELAYALRDDFRVELGFGERSLKAQLRAANRLGVPVAAIIGPEEAERRRVTLRDMEAGEQREVELDELREWLGERFGSGDFGSSDPCSSDGPLP